MSQPLRADPAALLEAIEQQMVWERTQLELGVYDLERMLAELGVIEQKLTKSRTYLFPFTRRRLRRDGRELSRAITQRQQELERLGWNADGLAEFSDELPVMML